MSKKYVCVAIHTIKSGDTLHDISQMHDVPVELLMRVNRITNPYNLQIGEKLCIPGTIHTVQSGDSLYVIAKTYRLSLEALLRANPDIDPYNLRVGMRLFIPPSQQIG